MKKDKTLVLIDWLGLFFICLFVFFMPISKAAVEILFGLIFVSALIKLLLLPSKNTALNSLFSRKANLALALFFLTLVLSVFFRAEINPTSLRQLITKWAEWILFFYSIQILLDKKRVPLVFGVFLFSSFLVSIDGLYQFVFGTDFLRNKQIVELENFSAITASFDHFNNYSSYLAVVLSLVLGVMFFLKNKMQFFLSGCVVVLLFVNLYLTHSRGAILALAVGIVTFVFLLPQKKIKLSLFLGLSILILSFFIIPQARNVVAEMAARADGGRLLIWKGAIKIFLKSPFFGSGLGTFMVRIQDFGLEPLYAHNCYLQLLAESGIFSFIAFIWFILAILFKSFKKALYSFDLLSNVFLSAFIVILVHSFFDTQLYSLKLSALFWIIASLTLVSAETETETVTVTKIT
ncbi:MAG: O-antigen ligase family protein [Candidatus Omnitrophica bacterium]|nr:O-antigen ligase family protein [Candidatus Omnitrophota bacterium]